MTQRRFTVVGAGAMGATVGAYLVRAGVPVTLVDASPAHVDAMNARGLTIDAFDERFTVAVTAQRPEQVTELLDVVLLAVKAYDTEAALLGLRDRLGASSVVVSMQNGLCEPRIAELIGASRTVGALVNYSAEFREPGVIRYAGPGDFHIGEIDGTVSDRVTEIATDLSHWGTVDVTDNIYGYLWGKLGYISMIYATALVNEAQYAVLDRARRVLVALATEVFEVADREGVELPAFDGIDPARFLCRDEAAVDRSMDALVEHSRLHQKPRSGVWTDIVVRKRRTEVDQHIGVAIRGGEQHGLRLPLNRALAQMIGERERGLRRMGWENLDELKALHCAAT